MDDFHLHPGTTIFIPESGNENYYSSVLLVIVEHLGSGRGPPRAEHAEGTPTPSHISPSILVYEEKT